MKLPSTSTSAPGGVDEIEIDPCSSGATWLETCSCVAGLSSNFARSSWTFPLTYPVISVPLGMLMSLPRTNRKRGAAGKNTIAVDVDIELASPAHALLVFGLGNRPKSNSSARDYNDVAY